MATKLEVLTILKSDNALIENGVFKGPMAQHQIPVGPDDTIKYTLNIFQTTDNHFEISRFGRRVMHDPDVAISCDCIDILKTWMLFRQTFTLLRLARSRTVATTRSI